MYILGIVNYGCHTLKTIVILI